MAKALADKPAEDFAATDDVVFLKIDPESGLLARDGQPDAVNDVFRKGTEPTQFSDKSTQQQQRRFYDYDQGGPEDTTPKKPTTEEVSD